ncbi:hypothetical protein CIK05_13350 [Bdellovibrio sp. qaytius]|nr:hypothetical protein CIK05_13350 [Bdellovibrio sp. qaytius]
MLTLMRLTVLVMMSAIRPAYAGYSVINDSPKLSVYPEWLYSRMMATNGWRPSLDASQECKLSFSSPELLPEKCEANYKLSYWETFLSKLYVDFNFTDQTKFQRIQFEPQAGLKIRGLLGLQTVNGVVQKKPLIIVRMGIFGNIDEILAERFLARIAYQDLGFHILLVESLTSHGYLMLNDTYSIGGIEEGLHTFYILNLITHNKLTWAKDVSDVYLMGLSLSGPGVFIANYLDEHSLINGKAKKANLKAIELFCPLVNFDETYKEHSKPGLFSAVADLWNRKRLLALRLRDKKLEDIPWWKTIFDLTPRFMPQALGDLNLKRGKPVFNLENFNEFNDLKLPQEFVDHVAKSKTLFELNQFWNFYKNEQTPIHIYLTPNDPLVMNKLNSELIREHKQPGVFNKVQFTDLKGMHCALAAEYQWPFLVELVRRGFEIK